MDISLERANGPFKQICAHLWVLPLWHHVSKQASFCKGTAMDRNAPISSSLSRQTSAPQSSSCTSSFQFLLPVQHTRAPCSSFKLHSWSHSNYREQSTDLNAWNSHSRNYCIFFSFPYPPLLINISSRKCLLGNPATTRPTSGKMRIHMLPWLTSLWATGLQ